MNEHAWLIAIAVAAMSPQRAGAATLHPALHWSRAANAADCIDPRTLAELVEGYTGPVLVPAAEAGLSIEGHIEREQGDTVRVRIAVTAARGRPAGERVLELRAVDCRKLDAAVALVIATTIDPALGEGSLPAEVSSLTSSEMPSEQVLRSELAEQPASPAASASGQGAAPRDGAPPPPSAADEPEPGSPSVARDVRWELAVGASVGTGTVAGPSAGVLLALGHVVSGWFWLSAQLRAAAGLTGHEIDAERAVYGQSLGMAALACARSSATLAAQFCLGPEFGGLRVSGRNFEQDHAVVRSSMGGLAKLELHYGFAAGLSATAGAMFALELGRKVVEYRDLDGFQPAFPDPHYSLHFALGLAHAF